MGMQRINRVLAIAVATGRIGYVYLIGDRLKDWGLSRKASKTPALAAAQTERWITELEPDVVVTEIIPKTSTKSFKTRALITAIQTAAAKATLLDVHLPRIQKHKNKYEEATHLAERYPELSLWVPKPRRIWEPEPRTTVLFEALALAITVLEE
jgi:tRNA U34 5-methylaminomethyl-2-thiouridine-forming methyltransferase MnmC